MQLPLFPAPADEPRRTPKYGPQAVIFAVRRTYTTVPTPSSKVRAPTTPAACLSAASTATVCLAASHLVTAHRRGRNLLPLGRLDDDLRGAPPGLPTATGQLAVMGSHTYR